jgi:formate/nitrite transporter FocA (FNT family)
LAVGSKALSAHAASQLIKMGSEAIGNGAAAHLFWSGVIAGWLIALVAWMVTASHWTIGQVVMIWLLTFIVGVGNFAHCIVTSCEILSAVVGGPVSPQSHLHWLLFATLGNIVGGVVIVSLSNYGQVKENLSGLQQNQSPGKYCPFGQNR